MGPPSFFKPASSPNSLLKFISLSASMTSWWPRSARLSQPLFPWLHTMFYPENLLLASQNSQIPSYLYNCSCPFSYHLFLLASSKKSVHSSLLMSPFWGHGGGLGSWVVVLPSPLRLIFISPSPAFFLQPACCVTLCKSHELTELQFPHF